MTRHLASTLLACVLAACNSRGDRAQPTASTTTTSAPAPTAIPSLLPSPSAKSAACIFHGNNCSDGTPRDCPLGSQVHPGATCASLGYTVKSGSDWRMP